MQNKMLLLRYYGFLVIMLANFQVCFGLQTNEKRLFSEYTDSLEMASSSPGTMFYEKMLENEEKKQSTPQCFTSQESNSENIHKSAQRAYNQVKCTDAFAMSEIRQQYKDEADSDDQDSLMFPHYLYPGRVFYNTLLETGQEKHWAMQLVLRSSVATKGFDENSQRRPLQDIVFAENIQLKDIYLPARLAFDNKIRFDDHPPRAINRPQNSQEGFGTYASDQYLYLLACAELTSNLEAREFGCSVNTSYRFTFGDQQKFQGVVGLLVPIINRLHILNLGVRGGSLFSSSFVPFGVGTATPLTEFNRAFTGLFDFFERGVLDPKGITFQARQRAMGFGDIKIFSLFDFARDLEMLSSLQVGTNIIVPTGRTGSSDILFPISLGGGTVQIDFFVNTVFSTRARIFNPAFYFVWNGAPRYATNQRIPIRISNDKRQRIRDLINNENILDNVPGIFRGYYVDPFSEIDSSIPAFATTSFPVILQRSQRLLFGFGNYAYNFLGMGPQLAVFYSIMHKGSDRIHLDKSRCKSKSIVAKDSNLDIASVVKNTSQQSHAISWTLSYQFKNLVELNIGSQHVVLGKNVVRTHEFFASFVAVF